MSKVKEKEEVALGPPSTRIPSKSVREEVLEKRKKSVLMP